MTLQDYKDIDRLIAEELNVNNVEHELFQTNEGSVSLNYNLEENTYEWLITGKKVSEKAAEELDKKTLSFLQQIYPSNNK